MIPENQINHVCVYDVQTEFRELLRVTNWRPRQSQDIYGIIRMLTVFADGHGWQIIVDQGEHKFQPVVRIQFEDCNGYIYRTCWLTREVAKSALYRLAYSASRAMTLELVETAILETVDSALADRRTFARA